MPAIADASTPVEVPLNQANLDNGGLVSWATKAITEAMTFDYLNYQREMQAVSQNFTKTGWENFHAELGKSGIIDAIPGMQRYVTVQFDSPLILMQKGVFSGRYRWILTVPLTVNVALDTKGQTESVYKMQLQLVVDRISSSENSAGVAIAQWIVRPKK